MKKSGSVMATEGQNALGCNEKLGDRNNYEGKFNTLRIISLKGEFSMPSSTIQTIRVYFEAIRYICI